MGEEEGRLMVLEAEVKMVAQDISDMKSTMADIAKSLSTLAVLEVRHNTVSESLSRAFKAIESQAARLDDCEKRIFASGWVLKVISGGLGLIAGIAGSTIMSLLKGK